MPTTKSASKALRQNEKKHLRNLFWKRRIKAVVKNLDKSLKTEGSDTDILKKQESLLQKALDKAAKNNVIHRNKANRLKARYAKKIIAHTGSAKPTKPAKSARKTGNKSKPVKQSS